MPSIFFWATLGIGGLLWLVTKSFMAGLLPLIVYLLIRVIINLMLVFTEAGKRI